MPSVRPRLDRLSSCVGAAVVTVLLSTPVAADVSDADRATARALAEEGQAALDAKDFATAADRFGRANSIIVAPTLQLGLATALVGQGRLLEAQETLNRAVRAGAPAGAPDVWVAALEDARVLLASIEPRLGAVTIKVTGASDPTVTLDDRPVPAAALDVRRPANPGTRVVRATAPGKLAAVASVEIPEGQHVTVELALRADPNASAATVPSGEEAAPPTASEAKTEGRGDTQRLLGWIGLGVGGAGLAAGSIFGMMAIAKRSELVDACPGGDCPSGKKSALDSYRSTGTLSTVGFVVGAVGAGAGLALLLTAPSADAKEEVSVAPWIGVGSAGVVGRFR